MKKLLQLEEKINMTCILSIFHSYIANIMIEHIMIEQLKSAILPFSSENKISISQFINGIKSL